MEKEKLLKIEKALDKKWKLTTLVNYQLTKK